MTGDLIRLEGVVCDYGGATVLEDVDLAVAPGRFIGVVGPSGSGKTSLLRTLIGTLVPRAGSVTRRPALSVAYVPQVGTIDWSFPVTVAECALMGRTSGRLLPWASRAERADVAGVLERLGIGDLSRRHIRELSGGQQQRVFLARALMGRPELLLLDEPTSGVDVRVRHEVLHLLDDLNAGGMAIVLTTHDLNGIAAHLPRLVLLNRRVIAAGRPRDVLTPAGLELTYGTSLEVLEHGGMTVVVDAPHAPRPAGADGRSPA